MACGLPQLESSAQPVTQVMCPKNHQAEHRPFQLFVKPTCLTSINLGIQLKNAHRRLLCKPQGTSSQTQCLDAHPPSKCVFEPTSMSSA